jgi:hypothetical protein
MNLETLAAKHRLKTRRSPEDDNDLVVNGKAGQIYEYSDSELAVSFTPGLDKNRRGIGKWCPKKWGNIRREALAAGMVLRQNGDSEGALSFDPARQEQAKLAIKIACARSKRTLTDSQKERLRAVNPLFRKFAPQNGHLII